MMMKKVQIAVTYLVICSLTATSFAEDWPRGYGEELISHHHHRHHHHHRPTEQEFQQCFSSLSEIRPCVRYIIVSAFSFNFNADEASDCCGALMDIPEECFAYGERRLHWVKYLCKSFLPAPPVSPSRHKPRHKPSPSAPTPPSPNLPKPSPSTPTPPSPSLPKPSPSTPTPTPPSKSPPSGLFAEYPTEP
ncbi:hypothetical protein CJ030_MR6G001689 [Morella rubra]|uniref:Prolamin-like domain-containing protein n=1 Tax=Morella rubra TaxID=262757 RepID=A0A6A1V7X2_9ROSI|nr:hypothetical protein CJ030_MR6G001689 [Morella rubra]